MASESPDMVLIADFGSQVTQLIARKLRELGAYCEIHPCGKVDDRLLEERRPKAIILSGGPASALDAASPSVTPLVFKTGAPVLGICYGQQIMARMLGGAVDAGAHREFGRADVTAAAEFRGHALFAGMFDGGSEEVWMSHGDRVASPPPGFRIAASSKGAPCAVLVNDRERLYGTQFHPEVHHTPNGARLLENFIGIAGVRRDWTMKAYRERMVGEIRSAVKSGRVICGLSGGVDSSVTAALVHQAIGDQLTCVFVDTGLMRRGEADEVVGLFRDHYSVPLIHAEESARFMKALKGVTDPERKRKAIGAAFIDAFSAHARSAGGAGFLAQGTLYPDVVESHSATGGPSSTIKSHHNVGGLPEKLGFGLVEPLRELFKDEVRLLGRELGLPEALVSRHPFPGPGLAIRCIGEVTPERVETLRHADAIFMEQIRAHGLYGEIWQAFAALLPVKSVGVMGDGRTYESVCALRAVSSVDGMTADFHAFSPEFLSETAGRIVNEVRGINRVVYDVTSKPPGTIEWE